MDILEIIAIIIFGGGLIMGIIGVLIERKRNGKRWIGQGFGEK